MPKRICGSSRQHNFPTMDSGGHIDECSGCNLRSASLSVVVWCCNNHIGVALACFEMAVLQPLRNFQRSEVRLLLWGPLWFSEEEKHTIIVWSDVTDAKWKRITKTLGKDLWKQTVIQWLCPNLKLLIIHATIYPVNWLRQFLSFRF
jgi:hypothetical protein